MPGVSRQETSLAYWLERAGAALDVPLLSVEQIDAHEARLASRGRGGHGDAILLEVPESTSLLARVRARLDPLYAAGSEGRLVGSGGERLGAAELAPLIAPRELPPPAPEVRVALAPVAIHCAPRTEPLYHLPIDDRFDRNLCSTLRPQEALQLLLRWPDGPVLARTRYVIGWVDAGAPLSAPLSEADARAWLASERVVLGEARELAGTPIAAGTILPAPEGEVLVATRAGVERPMRPVSAMMTARPITRRAVLEAAFARLGERYGWAGARGGIDCSQLVQEIFASFGLHLPRNSGEQAHAGTSVIELRASDGEAMRERILDAAQARGVVLLHLPGHVMLYLGRAQDGRPMALHALAEYVEPCEGGGETLRVVDRVVVSDLALGRGSSRRALLERLTRVVVFGDQQ